MYVDVHIFMHIMKPKSFILWFFFESVGDQMYVHAKYFMHILKPKC